MQQLTAMDAVFLSMETRETPSHIGGLAILDTSDRPGFGFASFVDFLESRMALCPRFMWTVQEVPFGLDRPYWIERDDLSARDQVHRVAVPAPGGAEELSELAGLLFARPLDRDRPLWEMFFIEGLSGGRVALLWKVHHCLMDGGSGSGLVELLFDLSPEHTEHPLVAVDDEANAGESASLAQMTVQALRNSLRLPFAQAKYVGRALAGVPDLFLDRNEKDVLRSAPRAPFNGAVGPRRSVAWSTVPLCDAMSIKDELGVKLNDVVLALTGGAVRDYLESRGDLPERSLIASVPVSTRSEGDATMGNQLSEVNVYWGTDLADPVQRVLAVHAASTRAKQEVHAGRGIDFVGLLSEAFAPGALRLLMQASARVSEILPVPTNAVVSNVRMTPVPIYIAGARVDRVVPISLLAPTQGLNITVVSYCGELHFGVTADPDLLPDVWQVAGAIPKVMLALQSAVASKPTLGA